MTRDELIEEIKIAFPEGTPLEPTLLTACDCEECRDVREVFGGRSWFAMSDEQIDTYFTALPLFSPVAFREFVPAYMVRGLRRSDEWWGPHEVMEFARYNLLPDEVDDWWRERVEPLTPRQVCVIAEFLQHVALRDNEYLGAAPQAATEYWAVRLGRKGVGEAAEQPDAADEARASGAGRRGPRS